MDPGSPPAIRVMLVDDHPQRAAMVEAALEGCGCRVVSVLPTASGLLFQIEQQRPEVVMIDMESPDRDILESLAVLNRHQPTPVVMFARGQDPGFIRQAIDAGVSAYLAEGVDPAKVRTAIDVAIAQFERYQALRRDFEETRQELEERKLIDRAKRLLMAHQQVDEAQAYAQMRKLAMNSNQTIAAVATGVIALLDKGPGVVPR
ncbi:MAG: ANTAR domain-containing response regulator [Pseudomonadota bacterium]|jgi:two-component system, response regulator / RNA-binding antiterminator